MPVNPIVFIDTETTGLGADDEVWEIGYVRWDLERGLRTIGSRLVAHDITKADKLPEPFNSDHLQRYDPFHESHLERDEVAAFLWDVFAAPDGAPAVFVGICPGFDERHLLKFVEKPLWHYQLVDAEVFLMGSHRGGPALPPWSTESVTRSLGLDDGRVLDLARHHALDDALLAEAMFAAVISFAAAREEAQITNARVEQIAATVAGVPGLDPAAVASVSAKIAKADRWNRRYGA